MDSPSFVSVFDRPFDAAVCGAGFVGVAAARKLAAAGLRVLLAEPTGDLLWEATRALENGTGNDPAFAAWLDGRQAREAGAEWFDPARLEIALARELAADAPPFATLLYARPIAVEAEGNRIATITVATKGGPRTLRAARWIDATENGALALLCGVLGEARRPRTLFRSLEIHTADPGAWEQVAAPFRAAHPEVAWLGSARATGRRLRWAAGDVSWHADVAARVGALRAAARIPFVVSHAALRDFPVYDEGPRTAGALPENLTPLSPAWRGEALASPSERFALGSRVEAALPPASGARWEFRPPAAREEAYDVVVAGTGTGGALAALATGRAGARTLALDAEPYPGGIGGGGGINGYFHGSPGGLQDEVDRRTQAMTLLLTGEPATTRGWHHDAKKLALLHLFEEAGVVFRGGALLSGVEKEGETVRAVRVVGDVREERIAAAAFVDGTGDGDLCVRAGAAFTTGRAGDGRSLSYSQSVAALSRGERGLQMKTCNFDAGWVDPADPDDLTRARLAGIAQHFRAEDDAEARPLAVSPLLGLRQSRQIGTDAAIGMDDLVAHARFDDAVGITDAVADTHSVDFEFESDDMAFYYWTCRGFRHPLHCELPYRMLLPRGLDNVWIACRAAGISADASYGVRMQRDMQRLGEAAGLAAAQAARRREGSRQIDLGELQAALRASGALAGEKKAVLADSPLAGLDAGIPGVHLWRLSRRKDRFHDAVAQRLESPNPRVSFYAAAVAALWNDARAEARLIRALDEMETGPTPEEHKVTGAFGQVIDAPFWFQAAVLLRAAGTERCLPALRKLAERPRQPLNVRTAVALTLERLAPGLFPSAAAHAEIGAALDALHRDAVPDPLLPPNRSLWRALHGEPEKKLYNDIDRDTREDHLWQLHLVTARVRRLLDPDPGLPAGAERYRRDRRALVRAAFHALP